MSLEQYISLLDVSVGIIESWSKIPIILNPLDSNHIQPQWMSEHSTRALVYFPLMSLLGSRVVLRQKMTVFLAQDKFSGKHSDLDSRLLRLRILTMAENHNYLYLFHTVLGLTSVRPKSQSVPNISFSYLIVRCRYSAQYRRLYFIQASHCES